ncbi:hypothetical protein PTKIN_Ptkin05aG0068200 [Pterospermum kingtungense]
MANSIFKGHGSHHSDGQTTQCYSQKEAHKTSHGVEKTQTQYCYSQTHGHDPHHSISHSPTGQKRCTSQCQTNGNHAPHHAPGAAAACQGKTKTRGKNKKRGLIEKIKDGFSSDSGCSSSDSESDDEKCGTRKAKLRGSVLGYPISAE